MKKQLLIIIAVVSCISANAQTRNKLPAAPAWADKMVISSNIVTPDNVIPFNNPNPTTTAHNKNGITYGLNGLSTEAVVGNTAYDLQSNASSYPRLSNNGDGTMSAIWTYIPQDGTSGVAANRGTGYNYYNGSAWGPLPTTRIEGTTHRTGFVNLVVTGTGREASYGHSSTDSVVLDAYRPAKGTGAWTVNASELKTGGIGNTDTWARFASGGANNQSIHCIVNSNDNGAGTGSILYSRSEDNGATWNILRGTIPGLGLTDYPYKIGGDDYYIASRGDVVAVVVGDISTDVVLFKSTDNGNTWVKTLITDNWGPGGSYNPDGHISDVNGDGVADTVLSCGGDVNVTIDNTGMCHVFWGLMRMLDDSAAVGYTNFGVFLTTNGIGYWNESMPAPVTTVVPITGAWDWNGNGGIDVASVAQPGWGTGELTWGRYGNMGFSCSPSAAVDASGNIFVTFMAIDEMADTSLFFKSHYQIYVTGSSDQGVTWSTPYNVITGAGVTDDSLHEGSFPSIANLVDNNLYIVYQRDYAPGNYISNVGATLTSLSLVDETNNDPSGNLNDIVVVNVPVAAILGINEVGNNHSFAVSQNSPNPASGYTDINVTVDKVSDIKVEITTLTGQVTFTSEQKKMAPGNHLLTLNTSTLARGIYFYSVTADGEKITKRMVVE